jgi:tetratricopeptide (TPR) repeat protein
MGLISELRRRNVIRVGAAYLVAAWLVIQVAETIFPLFGFENTAARMVVVVLAIGFLPALAFAWVFELTPEGLKKEEDVDRGKSISLHTGKKLDRAIIVVLALSLAFFAFDKFVLSQSREASIAEQARKVGLSEAEERARVADEVVTYMLEDLKKRLDEFEGIARLDPGFDAALAYFEGLAPEDMNIKTLERYLDALTSAGDLRLREGKNADALRIWERSLEISGRLIERDPANANSWRRHGDAFVSLALASWEEPEKIVLNMSKALEFFEKAADRSLDLNEDLRSRTWTEPARVRERMLRQEAESAGWMTEVELHLGRAEAAIEWHEREIAIRREELSDNGNPVRLGDALKWGAVAYESMGDNVTGRSKRMEARQVFERLMQRDPDNFYWQRRYIESTLALTMADIYLGNLVPARQALADVEQRLDDLATKHADSVAVARMVTRMEIVYAQLWIDSSTKQSLEYASRGMSRLEPKLQVDSTTYETVIMHAEAAALAAYAMIIEGMATQGRELATEEIALVERHSGGSDYLPDKQVEVILLWLAGEQQRGDAIHAQMHDRGYRSNKLDRWRERLRQQGLLSD